MTDQPQPPPYDDHPVVVQQLGVTKQPARVPRPRGLPVVVLSIVVAVLAGYVAVLLIGAHRGDVERQQLACEVQRLGGRPIGQVRCPPVTPKPSPRPTVLRVSPTPVPVAVVSPSMLRGPAGPAGPPGPAGSPPRAAPAPSASRPAASPTARPSPTPSCRQPNPLPTGPRCLLQQDDGRR